MTNKNFSGQDLTGADFSGQDLTGADFSCVCLYDDLKSPNFRGVNLRNANFSLGNLIGTNFRGADLRFVNFSGANLTGANFRGANLENANFKNAYLRDANFTGTNLTGANLKFVYLGGANLKDADLKGANLEDILYKAIVIDNLYIDQESRDFIDKMQAEGYKYIIKSKNQGYFELEFMVADQIFDGIKNRLITDINKNYHNLFDEFLGLYYHGKHHYPNNQYAFKKN